jgi:hypothetical protein
MTWRNDGDGCWALLGPGGIIAAYGPDRSKEGWFRGFAFGPDGVATHESMWAEEKDIKKDIEFWFTAEGVLKPYKDRRYSDSD